MEPEAKSRMDQGHYRGHGRTKITLDDLRNKQKILRRFKPKIGTRKGYLLKRRDRKDTGQFGENETCSYRRREPENV